MLSSMNDTLIKAYEKSNLFKNKLESFDSYSYYGVYAWKVLSSFIWKNSDSSYVEYFKNLSDMLYSSGEFYVDNCRVYNEHCYLCSKGKLITIKNIPCKTDVAWHDFSVDIKIFELENEYYVDASYETLQDTIEVYILSSYVGLFNLINFSEKDFTLKLLNHQLLNRGN